MKKSIVIELDDVLNNLSEILNDMGITYNRDNDTITDPFLKKCIYDIASGTLTELGEKVMSLTVAQRGAKDFLEWLHRNGWIVILCTDRDLRFSYDITINWLHRNKIYYDYLFFAHNLSEFCVEMGINYVICNRPNMFILSTNITYFCSGELPNLIWKVSNLFQFRNVEEVRICLQSMS